MIVFTSLSEKENNHSLLCFFIFLCLVPWKTSNEKSDYAELLFPQKHQNTTVQPNNSLFLSPSHSDSQEENPPALPCRPDNLRNSAALPPNSQSSQLYPNIEDMTPHFTSPLPAMVFYFIRFSHIVILFSV